MLNILPKIANVLKSNRVDAWLENLERPEMPLPVTVNDCLLVSQMGYEVVVNDGQVSKVIKKEKALKKSAKVNHSIPV
ncbi:MAG: hypothetical protein ACYDG2_01695 [Ruminiclostridium sp.]